MPTPLIYQGLLYVLANNGVFDAYNLRTGDGGLSSAARTGRQRFQCVTGGGRWKDLPVERGRRDARRRRRPQFKQLATNSMGELLMATPALSDGVMYVRTAESLSAIGTRR